MAATPKFFQNVDDTVVNVSPRSCDLAGGVIHNNSAAIAFIQFFDALAADVTLGTTAPVWVAQVAASTFAAVEVGEHGVHFKTACSMACTTTATGNTAGDAHVAIGLV